MKTPRSCGDCKACCWAPEIKALDKAPGTLCGNCDIGKKLGCTIHASRPKECADFFCLYIQQPDLVPAHLSPWKSGVMITASDSKTVMVWKLKSKAALKPEVLKWIEECKSDGLRVMVADPETMEGSFV